MKTKILCIVFIVVGIDCFAQNDNAAFQNAMNQLMESAKAIDAANEKRRIEKAKEAERKQIEWEQQQVVRQQEAEKQKEASINTTGDQLIFETYCDLLTSALIDLNFKFEKITNYTKWSNGRQVEIHFNGAKLFIESLYNNGVMNNFVRVDANSLVYGNYLKNSELFSFLKQFKRYDNANFEEYEPGKYKFWLFGMEKSKPFMNMYMNGGYSDEKYMGMTSYLDVTKYKDQAEQLYKNLHLSTLTPEAEKRFGLPNFKEDDITLILVNYSTEWCGHCTKQFYEISNKNLKYYVIQVETNEKDLASDISFLYNNNQTFDNINFVKLENFNTKLLNENGSLPATYFYKGNELKYTYAGKIESAEFLDIIERIK